MYTVTYTSWRGTDLAPSCSVDQSIVHSNQVSTLWSIKVLHPSVKWLAAVELICRIGSSTMLRRQSELSCQPCLVIWSGLQVIKWSDKCSLTNSIHQNVCRLIWWLHRHLIEGAFVKIKITLTSHQKELQTSNTSDYVFAHLIKNAWSD